MRKGDNVMSNLALTTTATLSNCDTDKLESLSQRFVKFLDVSELSVKSYSVGVRKILSFLHCNDITQPTRETVILYKKELCKKYSANTTALYISALRRFFTWCESEGLYANITAGVKSPKISHDHKRDAFSATELKEIVSGMSRNTLQGKRDYAIFSLIASCGLRTVEVSRLSVGDMHKVAGVWTLDIQGKGRASADAFVKLSEPVQAAIAEYLKARGHVSPNEPLFASCSRRNRGGRLTTRAVSGVCASFKCEYHNGL